METVTRLTPNHTPAAKITILFFSPHILGYLPLFQKGTTPTAWFSSKRNTLSNLCCLDAPEMMTGCATLSFVLD